MPRRLLPLALLATALLLAACGGQTDAGEKFTGEKRAVADTIEDLSKAGRDKDAKRICEDLLAPDLVRKVSAASGECEKAIDTALDDADNFDVDVARVDVRGDTATARVESGSGKDDVDTLTLVRAGRGWRISALG